MRLEYDDWTRTSWTTSIAGPVNANYRGFEAIETNLYISSASGGWTADATVSYDIDRDGKGAKTWPLTGSPQIS